jgi:hypothetical protein
MLASTHIVNNRTTFFVMQSCEPFVRRKTIPSERATVDENPPGGVERAISPEKKTKPHERASNNNAKTNETVMYHIVSCFVPTLYAGDNQVDKTLEAEAVLVGKQGALTKNAVKTEGKKWTQKFTIGTS